MNGQYRAVPLAPGFWNIEEEGVRMFLLEGEDEALLVDAGFGGPLKSFLAAVTDKPVRRVVVTHSDGDHTGACGQFDEILMHPAEFERYMSRGGPAPERVRPLWEGERLAVGSRTLEAVLLPGHTPGSLALLERRERFLLAGDAVQNAPVYMFGPGRNMPAFVRSTEKLMAMAGAFDRIYCCHGDRVLAPDILPALRQGALDTAAGLVPGRPPIREGMPCRLYDCGAVRFLYDGIEP